MGIRICIDSAEDQNDRLAAIEAKLDAVLNQGVNIMGVNQEINATLDELKTYTDRLAATSEAQAAKVTEISDDIDKLITESTLDQATKDRLASHRDSLAAIASAEEAQAATLTAIAAKREDPLPPVVEPETPTEEPTETPAEPPVEG